MSLLENAVQDCLNNPLSFCKFISSNDAGATGGHQSGLYIPLHSWNILFDNPGVKGENKDANVKIMWQGDFETDSRFIYYGQKSRNEYRITRFGRGFSLLKPENVGDLFVLIKIDTNYYHAYIIQGDDDIESFFSSVGITADQTNNLIDLSNVNLQKPTLEELFQSYIQSLTVDFPDTYQVSSKAREFFRTSQKKQNADLDSLILNWLDTEFSLFKALEFNRYQKRMSTPFDTIDELVACANTLLNRRKSRAGKSLEHHLTEVFRIANLSVDSQVTTEDKKKPDFIFPGAIQYHDNTFNQDKLFFLAAKTTCKDRWRQILNEADRIEEKHLFTLQQGISENQLNEMYKHKVTLVVPRPYINSFPSAYRNKILSLENFVSMVRNK